MLGFSRWQIFKGLVALGFVMSIISLALTYFFPAPPSKIIMATAFKGSSFEFYGKRYQEILARSNVQLELRASAGAYENVKLLQDQNSGVQIAFVLGGVSDGRTCARVLVFRNRILRPILDLLFFG